MKFPEAMTVNCDIPCFICSKTTVIVMNVKMGKMMTNNDSSLTIPVEVGKVVMTCQFCDWEKDLRNEEDLS